MVKKFGKFLTFICLAPIALGAAEVLHPILPPATQLGINGAVDLDDDVYSADMNLSAEFAPISRFSLYADGAFRFLSYSYEYSMKGYVHNYCNLHVNGFNETYLGAKAILWKNIGLDINWRFPPGEGSRQNRFHRLNVEPFTLLQFSRHLTLGTAIRYNTFLEDSNYKPGDEFGLRGSLVYKFLWNGESQTGWQFTEQFHYQVRIQESENKNLGKPFRKMDDKYSGLKLHFDLVRYFNLFSTPIAFGLNYEIKNGTLFGHETGHRIAIEMKVF